MVRSKGKCGELLELQTKNTVNTTLSQKFSKLKQLKTP